MQPRPCLLLGMPLAREAAGIYLSPTNVRSRQRRTIDGVLSTWAVPHFVIRQVSTLLHFVAYWRLYTCTERDPTAICQVDLSDY